MENGPWRETGEHCFVVVEAWAQTEGGGNWLRRRVHNFCEGVEENRVHYLDVSGLIPENGNKDKKVHVSIYCFVLLCVLMWPAAKEKKCFWSSLKKKKKPLSQFNHPLSARTGTEFTQARTGRVNLHTILHKNVTPCDGWTILSLLLSKQVVLLHPLCSPRCGQQPHSVPMLVLT